MILKRKRHIPSSAVQRFGDWRQGEPQVILDNQSWLYYGKPDEIEINLEVPVKLKWKFGCKHGIPNFDHCPECDGKAA